MSKNNEFLIIAGIHKRTIVIYENKTNEKKRKRNGTKYAHNQTKPHAF